MKCIKLVCVLLSVCIIGLTSCRQHRIQKNISFVTSKKSRQNKRKASISHSNKRKTLSATLSLLNIVSGSPSNNIILQHTGFVLSYNIGTGTPSWVAWELTSEKTTGHVYRKDFDYMPDPQIEIRYQIEKIDYSNSGYDRGHMCPAGDMSWSSSAMKDCHYMTNICPQSPKLNQIYWERLESACRRWAKHYNSIYIVCGPIYKKDNNNTIGLNHTIKVPDKFFKVIVALNKGEERGIGFIYNNNDVHQTMENASLTINKIEELTGYDFFHELPDNIEEQIEAQNRLSDWR